MQIQVLYEDLVSAYSQENLNRLSSDIISLYRVKDVARLRKIHAVMYDGNQAEEERISRIFTKIITHYHPDRQEQIIHRLRNCYRNDDFEGLKKLDHILQVQKMDLNGVESGSGDSDIEYGDIWDYAAYGYSYINDEEEDTDDYDPYDEMIMNHGFIAAVKRKIYGTLRVEFPVSLLADMEIIEMAEYDIENLEGVEYCMYARIIDLSGNNLTEITGLSQLMRLEEVYLQNNHIYYIDSLSELPYLRVLDVSNNDIDDITCLFDLDSLEFLNAMGNRIPAWQLEKLSQDGVVIVA